MNTIADLQHYRYRGARASILLHEREMRRFVETWKRASAMRLALPVTDDPCYESREHLLQHILRAARGYMVWICEQLGLPDPQIEPTPEPDKIVARADEYLEHVLARWRLPLADVDEERMSHPSYVSRWGMDYSIDSMLEHAVCHPIRHTFQLEELMENL
jgi:hypothetical protein